MNAIIFSLSMAVFPFAAQTGEAITYVVEGETFEGYRSAAKSDLKGLVLIIHDWDGLTEYEEGGIRTHGTVTRTTVFEF